MPDFTPDPYLTADEVRARTSRGGPRLSAAEFSDEWIEEGVEEWEQKLEEHLGVAFTTRETVESVRVPGCTDRLTLGWPKVQSVVSLVINSATISSALYELDGETGTLIYRSGFSPTYPATVTYQHGYETILAAVKRSTSLYLEHLAAMDKAGSGPSVARLGFDGGASTSFIRSNPAAGSLTPWEDVNDIVRTLPNYRIPGVA